MVERVDRLQSYLYLHRFRDARILHQRKIYVVDIVPTSVREAIRKRSKMSAWDGCLREGSRVEPAISRLFASRQPDLTAGVEDITGGGSTRNVKRAKRDRESDLELVNALKLPTADDVVDDTVAVREFLALSKREKPNSADRKSMRRVLICDHSRRLGVTGI